MIDIVIPSPGESISEVRLGAWKRGDGEWVEKDDVITEIESDKATLDILATASGVLKVAAQTGDDLKVGAVVARIDEKAARPAGASAKNTSNAASPAVTQATKENVPAHKEISNAAVVEPKVTSVARKMAVDKGVDLGKVEGSGPGGRITKTDVEHAQTAPAKATTSAVVHAPTTSAAQISAPLATGARGMRRERMT